MWGLTVYNVQAFIPCCFHIIIITTRLLCTHFFTVGFPWEHLQALVPLKQG